LGVLVRTVPRGTSRANVPVHGINYKDAPEDAARFLTQLGNPFMRIGADRSGRVSIDWGVYGVPETYVINRSGRIVYKHVGPISDEALDKLLLPAVAAAVRGG
jgi:cytochrome c biogenesis protein CcmG, thiol:disulfide interchange protein DsbE